MRDFPTSEGERCACPVEIRQTYSQTFKEVLVGQILTLGDGTISSVCIAAGVQRRAATKWVQRCGTVSAHPTQRGHRIWTVEAKLKVIIETAGFAEPGLGLYLRNEGLYSHQITVWRAEVLRIFRPDRHRKKMHEMRPFASGSARFCEKIKCWRPRPRGAFSKKKST